MTHKGTLTSIIPLTLALQSHVIYHISLNTEICLVYVCAFPVILQKSLQ